MKKILKSDIFKIFLFTFAFFVMLSIFNSVADVYSINMLDRFLIIISITFSQALFNPVMDLLKRELHK